MACLPALLDLLQDLRTDLDGLRLHAAAFTDESADRLECMFQRFQDAQRDARDRARDELAAAQARADRSAKELARAQALQALSEGEAARAIRSARADAQMHLVLVLGATRKHLRRIKRDLGGVESLVRDSMSAASAAVADATEHLGRLADKQRDVDASNVAAQQLLRAELAAGAKAAAAIEASLRAEAAASAAAAAARMQQQQEATAAAVAEADAKHQRAAALALEVTEQRGVISAYEAELSDLHSKLSARSASVEALEAALRSAEGREGRAMDEAAAQRRVARGLQDIVLGGLGLGDDTGSGGDSAAGKRSRTGVLRAAVLSLPLSPLVEASLALASARAPPPLAREPLPPWPGELDALDIRGIELPLDALAGERLLLRFAAEDEAARLRGRR